MNDGDSFSCNNMCVYVWGRDPSPALITLLFEEHLLLAEVRPRAHHKQLDRNTRTHTARVEDIILARPVPLICPFLRALY